MLTDQQEVPVSEIISHHQNKEVFIPSTITQTTPFPPGNYIITYTIHDDNSGKSFEVMGKLFYYFESGPNPIAEQIKFCPFCGNKLDVLVGIAR